MRTGTTLDLLILVRDAKLRGDQYRLLGSLLVLAEAFVYRHQQRSLVQACRAAILLMMHGRGEGLLSCSCA